MLEKNFTEMIKEEYLNQEIDQPKYVFHGTKNIFDVIKPHQAIDNTMSYNSQFAVC